MPNRGVAHLQLRPSSALRCIARARALTAGVALLLAWSPLAAYAQSAPSPPAPSSSSNRRVKLLVIDFKRNDVDEASVKTLQSVVVTRLSEYPELEVISGEDMRNLIALEADRQEFASCTDASCMAEVADALGAELVVFGSVGALDQSKVLNLNLFDSKAATGLGRVVIQVDSVDQLPRKLRPKLHDLLGRFYSKNNMQLPPLPVEEEPDQVAVFDPGPWPWVAAGVGGALLAGGVVAAIVGYMPLALFNQRKSDIATLEAQYKDDGRLSRVETARGAQEELLEAREAWNGWGVFLFDGGIAAGAVGAVAVVSGLAIGLLLSPAADESVEAAAHAEKHQ